MLQPTYDTTCFDGTAKGQVINPSTGVVLSVGISIPVGSAINLEIENYNSIYFHHTIQNAMWEGSCNFLNMSLSVGIIYTLPVNKKKKERHHNPSVPGISKVPATNQTNRYHEDLFNYSGNQSVFPADRQ